MKSIRIIAFTLISVIILSIMPVTAPAAAANVTVEVLVPPSLKINRLYPFVDGLAQIGVSSHLFYSSNDPWVLYYGFVDRTGTPIVPLDHLCETQPLHFSEGILVSRNELIGSYRYCMIDKSGKVVLEIPDRYSPVRGVSDGLAAVRALSWDEDRWGFIDLTGAVVIPLMYEEVRDFSEGLAMVTTIDGQDGYIDKSGNWVFTRECTMSRDSNPMKDFSDGRVLVERNAMFGYLDRTGAVAIPIIYDWAMPFENGMARVKLNGKMGVIDTKGTVMVPLKYDRVIEFSEGMAAVELGKKWGFVDINGKEVVPPKYDLALSYSEGLAKVRLNEKYGFVDMAGNEVVAPNYYDGVRSFSDSLAWVELGEKQGFINKSGDVVIPIEHNQAASFSNGLARVRDKNAEGGKYGFIDKTGALVVPYEYDDADDFSEGLAWVEQNKMWGILEVKGTGQTTPQAATQNEPSDWAKDEVNAALAAGLAPGSIVGAGWQSPTSRLAAAEAIVLLIEKATGKTMEEIAAERGWVLSTNHFADTDNKPVTFLRYAGITTGVGNDNYDPASSYTRAAIVTMIGRTAEVFFDVKASGANPFTDVPGWAAPFVGYAAENGITQGIGSGMFNPNGVLQNQHTAAFIHRAYQVWK